MQFAAVVVDEPLLLLRERSIEIYGSNKMLACTSEVLHFIFNPHGLTFSGDLPHWQGSDRQWDGRGLYRVSALTEN